MGEIPEEMVVEILKRLPVKSLMRFKATSKGSCALIKSCRFTKLHPEFSPDRLLLLLHLQSAGIDILHDSVPCQFFSFPQDDESLAVLPNSNLCTDGIDWAINLHSEWNIATCDGIVCFYGNHLGEGSPPVIPITLWNPATREVKSLPTSTYSASIDQIGYWDIGFGYDPKTDDYKVVTLFRLWEDPSTLKPFINYVEVYSLKTNSWRLVDAPYLPCFNIFRPPSTYTTNTTGFSHWFTPVDDDAPHDPVLVSFDMGNEVFRTKPPPPSEPGDFPVILATLNDSVVALCYQICSPVKVWVLMDDPDEIYGECCWTLEYILELPADTPHIYDPCMWPLGLWNNFLAFKILPFEDNAWHYDLDDEPVKELSLYDLGTKEITKIEFPGDVGCVVTYKYKETLVSLASN